MAAAGNRSTITRKKIGVPRQRQQLQFKWKLELKCVVCSNHLLGRAMISPLPSWNWRGAPRGPLPLFLVPLRRRIAGRWPWGVFELVVTVIF